uniref:Ycf34 n=1 Tax=Bornetia secundiflora TaxID=2575637 RepID=A0A4D6WMX8_9FLOR|nr:hypothetical protein [Bornetia secundiflora]
MCICVNCRHIHYCATYKFIEKQHQIDINNHIIYNQFIPSQNTIQINIKTKQKSSHTILDWDLIECLSFMEKPGTWLLLN